MESGVLQTQEIAPAVLAKKESRLEYRIRAATLADVEEMIGLLRGLFALEPDFVFDAGKQRRGLVQLICRREGNCVLVAESDDRVVGMCTAQTVISTAEGGPVGWVEDVVVAPACRGRGVGARLLSTLEQWAWAQGLRRLQLAADQGNDRALKFYTGRGWKNTRLRVLRKSME